MANKPGKAKGPPRYAGDPETPGGFRGHLIDHTEWMHAMHFSEHTIKNRRVSAGYFIDWCEERSIARPDDVTRAILERYRQYVFHYRRKDSGDPLSFRSQAERLIAVRMFFKWLTRSHHLLFNPASELDVPKRENRLPRHILTVAEVEQVLNAVDVNEASGLGLRDRAMLETLYSTGMRRGEVVGLRVDDVDRTRGTLMVRQGKGRKDRVAPIGSRALAWVEKYLYSVRERYIEDQDPGILFLAKHGEAMSAKQLSYLVKKTIERAALERFADVHPNAACHLFRHACATHMLENGCDIRYIQALLGHADLNSTQIYTQVSIDKLKAIHTATHPARWEGRRGDNGAATEEDAGDAKRALLAALDAERDVDGAEDV